MAIGDGPWGIPFQQPSYRPVPYGQPFIGGPINQPNTGTVWNPGAGHYGDFVFGGVGQPIFIDSGNVFKNKIELSMIIGTPAPPGIMVEMIPKVNQPELNVEIQNVGTVDLCIALKQEYIGSEKSEVIKHDQTVHRRMIRDEVLWVMTVSGEVQGSFLVKILSRAFEREKWDRVIGGEPDSSSSSRVKRKPMED